MAKFILMLRSGVGAHPWLTGLLLVLAVALCVVYLDVLRLPAVPAVSSVLLPSSAPPPAPKRPTLIATYRDVPPEMVVYSPGRHAGPLRATIEEAADKIGYDIEWKSASFADSVAAVSKGDIDIVPSVLFKTAEREKSMRFSVSLGRVPYTVGFLQRSDNKSVIKSVADLKGRTVGYRRSVLYFNEFESLSGFKRVVFGNDNEMMRAFANRAVDVVVVNNKVAAERAQFAAGINSGNYAYADLTIVQEVDLYLLYSRMPEKQAAFDRLDQAFLQMKEVDLITDIFKSFNVAAPLAKPTPGTSAVISPANQGAAAGAPVLAPRALAGVP